MSSMGIFQSQSLCLLVLDVGGLICSMPMVLFLSSDKIRILVPRCMLLFSALFLPPFCMCSFWEYEATVMSVHYYLYILNLIPCLFPELRK